MYVYIYIYITIGGRAAGRRAAAVGGRTGQETNPREHKHLGSSICSDKFYMFFSLSVDIHFCPGPRPPPFPPPPSGAATRWRR